MFDSFYTFHYVTKIKQPLPVIYRHIFSFDVNSDRFIVHIDQLENAFYGIKFFPKSHRLSRQKFNVIINKYSWAEFAKILRTCVEIMFKFLKANPCASFGFIGSHSIVEDFEEPLDNTQRFGIYTYLMPIFFSTNTFKHLEFIERSAYIIFNTTNSDEILFKILNDISENYKIIFSE